MRLARARPIFLAFLLAPLAIVLGYIGYRSSSGPHLSITDTLYKSLQLFVLDEGVTRGPTPWELDVARFLAPIAAVYAAVLTVAALLRDQAQRALVSTFSRGHVVVAGLGATGSMVAQGLRSDKDNAKRWEVVAVEADTRNVRLPGARAEGIRIITGDATDQAILRRAQVGRARHVVVMTGDDSRNLEVAASVRQITGDDLGPITLHVAIADTGLWTELHRLQFGEARPCIWTEYFNLADRTAQRLLNHADDVMHTKMHPRVLITGHGDLAMRTTTHHVRRTIASGKRPRIDLASPGANDLLARLRDEERWCFDCADIDAVDIDDICDPEGLALCLVCVAEDDAVAITRGLALARKLPHATVVVAVYRALSQTTLEGTGADARRVHLAPAKLDALGQELLANSAVELMAQARHEDYRRTEQSRGDTLEHNSSLAAWENLPESLRESNRRFAESVAAVLGDLDASLVPLTTEVLENGLPLAPVVLERLARREHERWVRSLQHDGWTHHHGPKNAQNRQHPLLVPWEQLEEPEREKDRDALRALPSMLARVGYAIVLEKDGSRP